MRKSRWDSAARCNLCRHPLNLGQTVIRDRRLGTWVSLVEVMVVHISRPSCFALRNYILVSGHKHADFIQMVRKVLRLTCELLDPPYWKPRFKESLSILNLRSRSSPLRNFNDSRSLISRTYRQNSQSRRMSESIT
jgi:hypothetical protein